MTRSESSGSACAGAVPATRASDAATNPIVAAEIRPLRDLGRRDRDGGRKCTEGPFEHEKGWVKRDVRGSGSTVTRSTDVRSRAVDNEMADVSAIDALAYASVRRPVTRR